MAACIFVLVRKKSSVHFVDIMICSIDHFLVFNGLSLISSDETSRKFHLVLFENELVSVEVYIMYKNRSDILILFSNLKIKIRPFKTTLRKIF